MSRALCALVLTASTAAAADSVSLSGTTITLAPGQYAEAEVSMRNLNVNTARDNGTHVLTGAGLSVTVTFTWNPAGADRMTVVPPEGWACAPYCTMDVPENATGVIELYRAGDAA